MLAAVWQTDLPPIHRSTWNQAEGGVKSHDLGDVSTVHLAAVAAAMIPRMHRVRCLILAKHLQ